MYDFDHVLEAITMWLTQFGDGIVSMIDCRVHVAKKPDPKGTCISNPRWLYYPLLILFNFGQAIAL